MNSENTKTVTTIDDFAKYNIGFILFTCLVAIVLIVLIVFCIINIIRNIKNRNTFKQIRKDNNGDGRVNTFRRH